MGSRALRNTVLVLAAKVVARLIALVTVIATLKQLMPAPYGTFITLVNYTAIVSVMLDLGFNVLFVREGARRPTEIQRYLRNVMSLRALMSVASLVVLAILINIAGLGFLLAPGFALMVLTSYASLLRNTLYAVHRLAYKPFEALLFVPMTLLSVVFPALSIYHRDSPAQMIEAVGRFFKALFVIGWPMSVGIFVLAHPLTHSLQLYDQSEPALRILALGLAIGFANNAFIGALSASDHQASFTWAAGWSLLANVALNLALIPTFGYIGASWATVATEIVLGSAGWYLTARHLGRVPVFASTWVATIAGLVMGVAVYPMSNL